MIRFTTILSESLLWKRSRSTRKASSTKSISEANPNIELKGINYSGAEVNLAPYLMKLSIMFLMLRTMNIIITRLINPRYF